ncbi:alpha/beta hydrolase [Aeromonas caviae]|uniref:alpha/beta hydrolase n=1 Tax=Aeromonas TaxID=642 RepID=UPI000FEBB67D|nr:alpha/beta hydrolase [Aeromonas caviae]MBL0497056.1 alpha/beta hydrolase [Aeromonas caviae]RWT74687.1 alpha/beta hydrolase [Aeromonas caviae]
MEKQLEPAIAAMVTDFIAAGRPKASQLSWQARRDGYLASALLGGEREEVGAIEEWQADHHAIRCYRPADKPDPAYPVLIYFHGGCFVSGDFETHDRQMRMLCNRANALVFAVHTRLAPEHPYPAAHDDALAATRAIMADIATWLGDPERILLAGDSAGGHLALVTTLRLKEAGEALPAALLLLYPMLDALGESPSYDEFGDDCLITRDMLLSGFEAYLGALPARHPEASPLYHPALDGLPPTHIVTAQYDPLRDEGEALYGKLLQAGVSATCQRQLGVIHGYFQLAAVSPAARQLIDQVATLLRGI